MSQKIRQEVKEEFDLIAYAGELPEVAFYESLHYLTEDPQGPCLKLSSAETLFLKKAVVKDYVAIILRDLNPDNRDKGSFRGVERAIINFQRLKNFAEREGLEISVFLPQIANSLNNYVREEINDSLLKDQDIRTINCSFEQWIWFCNELGIKSSLNPTFFKRRLLNFQETINLFRRRQKGP